MYFDYKSFAKDLIRDGELVDLEDDYKDVYVTNGNQF